MVRKSITEVIATKGGLAAARRHVDEKLAAEKERKGKAPAPAEPSQKEKPPAPEGDKLVFGGMKDPKAGSKRKESEPSDQPANKKRDDGPAAAPKPPSDKVLMAPSSIGELTAMQRKAMAKGILALPEIEEGSEQLLKNPGDPFVTLVTAIAEMACVAKAFGKKKVAWEKKEKELDHVSTERVQEQKQARLMIESLEKTGRAERANARAEIERLQKVQKEAKIKEDKLVAENAMLRAEVAELKLRPASKEEVVEEFLLSDRFTQMQDEDTENTFAKACRRFMRCMDKLPTKINLHELDKLLLEEPDSDVDDAVPEDEPTSELVIPTEPVAAPTPKEGKSGEGLQLIPFQAASPIFIPPAPFGEIGEASTERPPPTAVADSSEAPASAKVPE